MDKKCLECGSYEVFVQINDEPIYRCFDCYCDAYESYMSNNDEE